MPTESASTFSEAACRLYGIQARDGRSVVVFRRGPSKRVLVLRWWLDGDVVEPGQWFKGRIYERRADLSPDGELLAYFAAKYAGPHGTWTAISRPPFLTALAFWPKGDAWGGGGLFHDIRTFGLNHHVLTPPAKENGQSTAAAFGTEIFEKKKKRRKPQSPASTAQVRLTLGNGMALVPVAEWAGRGEDSPIEHARMLRDGWRMVAQGEVGPRSSNDEIKYTFTVPAIIERDGGGGEGTLRLRRLTRGIGQRGGAWNVEDYEVGAPDGTVLRHLPNCSWADWSTGGDLLFTLAGSLYRLPARQAAVAASNAADGARLIADLTALNFAPQPAPAWATRWP